MEKVIYITISMNSENNKTVEKRSEMIRIELRSLHLQIKQTIKTLNFQVSSLTE